MRSLQRDHLVNIILMFNFLYMGHHLLNYKSGTKLGSKPFLFYLAQLHCMDMANSILLLVLLLTTLSFKPTSSSLSSLSKGFSLLVEKTEDIIVSPNGMFSAGFYKVGENAYCFAIWFTQQPHGHQNPTVVWMANRNQPVNGKRSKLSLLNTGNLALTDAGQFDVWASNTASLAPVHLLLNNNGNLVLLELQGTILWQSFDSPTDTLLPDQHLSRHTQLVSARSESNHSEGFYKLLFDNDNVLRLLYDGPDFSSIYWPDPLLVSFDAGRSTYNNSRAAVLDSRGAFISSDNFNFKTSDNGRVLQRRLKLDCDGNLRVYSRNLGKDKWYVSWQVKSDTCMIHGICGANSTCSLDSKNGRKCSCLPGYRVKNHSDWSYGCEPMFHSTCDRNEDTFLKMHHVEFYGNDLWFKENFTYSECENLCLQDCNCKGFQLTFQLDKGYLFCYTKLLLLNGRHSPNFEGVTYLRLPKRNSFSGKEFVNEDGHVCFVELHREYTRKHVSSFLRLFLWFASAVGAFEMFCIFVVWCFLMRTRKKSGAEEQSYHLAATGFRKFSYSELKKATKGFSQEIGRGAVGIVFKGILSDQRVAAIKRLDEAKQGEGQFLAEASIIGRFNHMNLIEMWGYCAEGKHRLLVYEYMENGSLADNLLSNTLDWSQRYNIALGTARALAYIHEECLEWILHCDIKPQNILLDSSYQPKIADFGLSKLLVGDDLKNPSFSMIRGTRGYMAPEWVFNLAITSKVDVYSYGIVVLEMITGKSPTMGIQTVDGGETHQGRLVTWVREKRSKTSEGESWVEQIIDPSIEPSCDIRKVEILCSVALACVEEDKDARPTMSQVVEILQSHENDS